MEKVIVGMNSESEKSNSEGDAFITSPVHLLLVCVGLVLAIFIAAIDETIVATAMGAITSELNGSSEVTWVSGAYLLTISAFTPLYGKFSDIFGRKPLKLFALAAFLGGSVMSAVATDMVILVIGRAIAGIGAGGLIALSYIIVSDVVPIHQRSMYLSLINITFAVANVAGPLVGGLLVDNVGWRWVFYINVPVVVICIVVLIFFIPLPKATGEITSKLKRIDVMGTVSLLVCITLFVLGMNWGGHGYSWSSLAVVLSLVASFVALVVFVVVEVKFAAEPVLPVDGFNLNVGISCFVSLVAGWTMFVFIYHWPMFFQIVMGSTATEAGVQLLPIMLGVCVFAALSGFVVTYIGSYRPIMWVGMGLLVVGCSLMTNLSRDISRFEQIVYPLIIGVGIGLNIQTVLISAQAAADKKSQAALTGFVTFCLNIGGVLGLSILGSILNSLVVSNMKSDFSDERIGQIMQAIASISQLGQDEHDLVMLAYASAYRITFMCMIPVVAMGFIGAMFLKNIPIESDQ
ncbi:hypothetical protein DSO57_1035600 [Entomophthora muscae]|uniref:Uncharacterized protein n=1 Tax=Entomophthora muscae TaxID=34485 RepID=A0ACC2TA58_9FUNG|nr:hypothetical protein DSO57_1035600 [Entomophthora muscae]